MAGKKEMLMAQFYEQCQQKGYTDMTNADHSLKAKVIATDLNLNYGKIEVFYEKAKKSYDLVRKEELDAQQARLAREQKEAQEAARRQVDGELLVTLSAGSEESSDATFVKVFIRPDETIYSTVNNGSKIEGPPQISVEQGGALLLTYHPSQAVYTGATVGGITTGGVHYTQAGYTSSKTRSGKGDIRISMGSTVFTLTTATMPDHTCRLFRRDPQFSQLVHDRKIKCYMESSKADFYYSSISTGRLDNQTLMNAVSLAADEHRLSYAHCERIANLLGRIVHGQFPPSDEQIYASAKALENAATSGELNRAMGLYRSIADYGDAAQRIAALQQKYDQILQSEKEQAVLAKEAKNRRAIKAAILFAVTAVVLTGVVFLSGAIRKNNAYKEALLLMDSGMYPQAVQALTELGDYKDCPLLLETAKIEILYSQAVDLMESGKYQEAIEAFRSLGDFRDSVALITESEEAILEQERAEFYEIAVEELAYLTSQDISGTVFFMHDSPLDYCPRQWILEGGVCTDHGFEDGDVCLDDYRRMLEIFSALGDYKDSRQIADRITQWIALVTDIHSMTTARYSYGYEGYLIDGDTLATAARRIEEYRTNCDFFPATCYFDSILTLYPYCGHWTLVSGKMPAYLGDPKGFSDKMEEFTASFIISPYSFAIASRAKLYMYAGRTAFELYSGDLAENPGTPFTFEYKRGSEEVAATCILESENSLRIEVLHKDNPFGANELVADSGTVIYEKE